MNPKVSIVVPIYNVDKYLVRCLDSLLNQTLKDIEIICVNDGSSDASLPILEKYEEIDKRINIINKVNGGVSSARNCGIDAARGEYIGFVDPDDWVDHDMYLSLYKTAISDKADIVMCSYIREFSNHSKEKKFNFPEKSIFENQSVKSNIMRKLIGPLNEEVANPELMDAWGTVWSKLFRADIIKSNEIRFTDLNVIGTNEDLLFNIQVINFAQTFVFLNKPYYHYWRANSGSVTTGFKPLLFDQWLNLYHLIEEFIKKNSLSEEYYSALNNRMCLGTLGLGLNTISKENKDSSFKKIKHLKHILKSEQLKNSFKQLDLKKFPLIWKVFYFSAKIRSATSLYFMLIAIEILRKNLR
ncbi:glycosyltransferase family 2 protein [Falsibacillus pallidus]|uniref:Glycosyltransferase EpsH n=1 Tax=Falsibacillus pallidus TaxID=493781 RepID=A0A370GR40_9BACI|nr:glycosyltransferase [Falsibacillus pallidus]RDI45706.1 glycosyltransferase EpsH [Falsibacillus pallidus]